jgi:hypothetical protein
MTRTARTDIHRPSAIVPADYDYICSFFYPTANEVGAMDDLRRLGESMSPPWSGFFRKQESGGCDICGANYIYGSVFKHRPTGEHIKVGWICADEMDLQADGAEQNRLRRMRNEQRRATLAEGRRARKRAEFAEQVASIDGLQAALDESALRCDAVRERQGRGCERHNIEDGEGTCGRCTRIARGWWIIEDIAGKGNRFGSISEKQAALCLKIHREELEREAQPEEPKATAPEGRQVIRGEVVSTKFVDNDFGGSLKMLVKVTTSDGVWKCWGSVPSALHEALEQQRVALGLQGKAYGQHTLKGQTVEFTGTLTRSSSDNDFAFFKRPSKAAVKGEAS